MEYNGAKRKEHPEHIHDRPLKQFRGVESSIPPANGTDTSADQTPNGYLPDASDGDARSVVHAATADSAEWQATIETVVSKVVSIHFCQTSAFDTDPALSSEATGFVVDEENGYIMTNRHVVGAGPFWGYVIFENHEECEVHPVYRDPVHDFGILKFDPKAIKYLTLSSLKLRPDLAKLGSEIRVVGNDAGEKLSILSGVISRLDRNAPEYAEGYCDFNTNYIQAAAAASGGSSGSPVVNIDGFAVALQAGGRQDGAATDYFLPLDRPLRALDCIRNGEPVTRGTIQIQWLIKPFDECRRLGLTSERESEVRTKFPKETGMLVAEVVLPKGPADSKIEEGDVLVKVNDELLTQFVRLDDILDSSVGGQVKLLVQRGGEEFDMTVDVGDLHSITPDSYVSVAGALFHDLSYQQARYFAVALKDQGAYCCEASGSFRFEGCEFGWLIQSVDNKPTPNVIAFVEVMKGITDRARVVVTYKHLRDMHTLNTSILLVDRHWHRNITLHTRNDESGLWDSKTLATPLPPVLPPPRKANFIQMGGAQNNSAVDVVRSFVKVSVSVPLRLDGFPKARKIGFGLVVDADKGLVIVSRAIVPYDMCDISVTIADSIIVDGKVVFLHPLQNYAIIQYDPKLVQAPVKTAKLATESIKQGESTTFFGFNVNLRPVVSKTTVTDITSVAIPASTTTPRYRAINLDAITVDSSLSERCGSGVLVAEDGTVQALWMSYLGERTANGRDQQYHLGFATPALHAVLDDIKTGVKPNLRILNLETHIIQMSEARIHGVSQEWIDRVETEDPERHQLFMVRKVDANHTGGLLEGDIVLTLNDRLVTRVTDFDVMYHNESLKATIIRKREQMQLDVATVPTEEFETKRSVIFCGAVLHRPHHAVRQQISKIHSDVYVSGRMPGSPAYMYGLAPTNFVTHVNGVATPDLDAFVAETNKIPDNTYFRLKLMTFDNQPWVVTMKQNMHYFPTVEFVKDPSEREGWRRVTYENGVPKANKGDVPDAAEEGVPDADGDVAVEPVDRLV